MSNEKLREPTEEHGYHRCECGRFWIKDEPPAVTREEVEQRLCEWTDDRRDRAICESWLALEEENTSLRVACRDHKEDILHMREAMVAMREAVDRAALVEQKAKDVQFVREEISRLTKTVREQRHEIGALRAVAEAAEECHGGYNREHAKQCRLCSALRRWKGEGE